MELACSISVLLSQPLDVTLAMPPWQVEAWTAYYQKYGDPNVFRRLDYYCSTLIAMFADGQKTPAEFLPYRPEQTSKSRGEQVRDFVSVIMGMAKPK